MIDNETTQILPGNNGGNNSEKKEATAQPQVKNTARKSNAGASKVAYAAGGFVAGVAATASAEAMVANIGKPEEEILPVVEDSTETTTENAAKEENVQETLAVNPTDSPSEQDVIIATDEGVRVAQVDDDKSFAEAFADARQQVGPGGVFEWHGKVYGTYLKDEWDQMSSSERAEWQAKVDYDDVRDGSAEPMYAHHSNGHAATPHHADYIEPQPTKEEPLMASNQEMVDDTPVDGEIKILGVETVYDADGRQMTIAGLEASDGDQALLVDIDNDGSFDVLLHDDNGNGQLDAGEVYDASDMNMNVADLQQGYAQQNGMDLYACNDDMPDYSNDADVSSFA